MYTFMPKAEEIQRKWYVIDAAQLPLGRVAARVASILRGKHKSIFTPHVDCGDHVIVVNCSKVVLTGNKLTQKYHYWHTGYIGHLKSIRYDDIMKNRPKMAVELAVKGMLPHNSIGRRAITRLRLYENDNHEHVAQNPEVLTLQK
ncbi:MAG: 50S ribosomal protein L13 [Oscillospiraceae bacterium]|jgi:large subunit ribosomal protein L13|nr:50S ribosomal protein L13 [Oscillospiraceae bacterium]